MKADCRSKNIQVKTGGKPPVMSITIDITIKACYFVHKRCNNKYYNRERETRRNKSDTQ